MVQAEETKMDVEMKPEEMKAELAEARAALAEAREELERVRRAFESYRAAVEGREALARKKAAYRRLLSAEHIPERFHDRILRLTDLGGLELDGEGLRDEGGLREAVRREWGDYVAVDATRGVQVDTPPATARPGRMTVEEIMAVEDDARRERLIAENHELFGF